MTTRTNTVKRIVRPVYPAPRFWMLLIAITAIAATMGGMIGAWMVPTISPRLLPQTNGATLHTSSQPVKAGE